MALLSDEQTGTVKAAPMIALKHKGNAGRTRLRTEGARALAFHVPIMRPGTDRNGRESAVKFV
jgi:hypothetical protein